MVTVAAAAGTLPLLPLLLRSHATAGLARQSSAAAGAAAAAAAVGSPRLFPAGGLAFRRAAGQWKPSHRGLHIASTPLSLGVLGSRSGGSSSSNSGGRGGIGSGSNNSSCTRALKSSKTTSIFTKGPGAAAAAASAAAAGPRGGGGRQMAAASEISAARTASASPAADAAGTAAAAVETAPYGTWRSPLSAAMVSGSSLRFGGMAVDGADRLLWMEGRASEGGRGVVMRETAAAAASTAEAVDEAGPTSSAAAGTAEEVTPAGMSVKSRVHEYGGGAFGVFGDVLVFSNKSDQRLYRQSLRSSSGGSSSSDAAAEAVPLTPDYGGSALVRYADPSVDLQRGLVFCVREDGRADGHGGGDHPEPRNDIVAVRLDPSSGTPLEDPVSVVSGSDFYAFPRVSADGRRLAWMQWEHPYMPWDRSTIWVATLDERGRVVDKECVAGGDDTVVEAPVEPVWSSSGDLYFVTDRGNGFWNIHRWVQSGGKSQVERVVEMDAEFSLPLWVFGTSCFVFHPASPTHIVCFYQRGGLSHLAVIDTQTKAITTLDTMPGLTDMQALASGVNRVFLAAGSPTLPLSIFEVHMAADMRSCTLSGPLWQSSSLASDAPSAGGGGDGSKQRPLSSYLSQPYWTEFPTGVAGEVAHALVYPPHNPDYAPPEGEAPPLLVKSHGGPTGATSTSLRLPIQYWTSRGWAVADVNYSGSTGYGRAYRERLLGQWGVRDVDDICACVKQLVSAGLADEKRVVTDGSSAGGFTTLAVLTFRDVFRAGCSLYGISDLEALAATTHKFEKHYTDRLVAPPSEVEVYRERSPIHHIDQLNCPVILFQGMEDKVVPPSQAREMYIAVKNKGLPVALIEYEGEDHGFRKAENIEKTLELEMLFFARIVLGRSSLPDIDRDLVIDNLPSTST